MKYVSLCIFCVVVVFASGCAPRQSIKYSMDDVTGLNNSPFAQSTLVLKTFGDHRKPLETDCKKFDVSTVRKNEKLYYYNCDNHYKSDSIARDITKVVAEHINKSKLFREVVLEDIPPSSAEYLLMGNITKFDGLKQFSVGSVVAAQFGLLGALVNLAIDSNYEATTVLDGLQLVRLKDNTVLWKGDVTGHIEGADMADAYGWTSYHKANQSLKEANSKLVISLAGVESETVRLTRETPPPQKVEGPQ